MSVLTEEQKEQFLTEGYIVMKECFTRETAKRYTDRAWERLGYDPDDPSTWEQEQVHMPALERWEAKEFAPKAWAAMCELMGGEDRVAQPCLWGDSFILNLRRGADRPWQPPSADSPGWHKDGDFFVHFLDSPEQGLLTLVLWDDMKHMGGGTFVVADSVGAVARFLAEHPEGLRPGEFDYKRILSECHDFREMTGEAGDVVILHPFILHASSQNALRVPRFITNPAVNLKAPMEFDRPNPDEFSLVERAVLRGLGVDRYDYRPTGQRERIVPERVKRQQAMLEAEKARLASKAA
jgi:hypothetical protein